jgi:hypothetical protein
MALFSSGTPRYDDSDLGPGQFHARYYGTCADCGGKIEPEQVITYVGDDLVHVDCAPRTVRESKVCQRCFIAHAGECF